MRGWMTAGVTSRGRRLLSAAVAIVLGVAFLTASLVVLATAKAGVEDAVAAGVRDADLVVSLPDEARYAADAQLLDTGAYDDVAAVDGVAGVHGETFVAVERGQDILVGAPLPVSGVTLLEGTLPEQPGDVLVTRATAEGGVDAGDDLTVTPLTASEGSVPSATVHVSGVADFGDTHAVLGFSPGFAATDATLRALDPALTYDAIILDLEDGSSAGAVTSALLELAPQAQVLTGQEAAEERVALVTGETMVFSAILLGFGAIALLTASIVIANTFTITLAQRAGELALLRCVGATRGQVRSQVLVEAVLLGVVASAGGVAAGIGVAAGLLAVGRRFDLGIPMDVGLEVGVVSLLAPIVVGTVVTVLASLWPAVRATRVSPLAALRPAGPSAEQGRVGWVRVGIATVLVATGVAAMLYGATQREVLAGVVGGVVSFVGVLVAAVVIVPAAVRAVGVAAGVGGVPGRLAVDNAVRNPGRAAATSAALLVGVTLITMTSVGAATGQRTALGEIDEAFAVDLMVTTGSEDADPTAAESAQQDAPATPGSVLPMTLDPGVTAQLSDVVGVAGTVPIDTAYVVLDEDWGVSQAVGVDPATAGAVIRSSDLLASVAPGTVGMSNLTLTMYGLQPGDTVPVHGAAGEQELTVVKLGLGSALALHEQTLTELAGETVRPGGVLVRLADDADLADVMTQMRTLSADHGLLLEGAALERAMVVQVLDVLVLVATALLGVAVIIAVVGIANTLALSVVERHREHALLRGLGLTRGQMRAMLLTEGVLLALVSAGLGLLLGLGYAVLGIQTLLPQDTPVQLAVPWARVGLIVGLALVAGVLASVLPARRAARVSPAAGLATA